MHAWNFRVESCSGCPGHGHPCPPILFGTRMYLPNDKNAKIWQDRPRRQGEGGPGSFHPPFARPSYFPPSTAKGLKKNDEYVRNTRSVIVHSLAAVGLGMIAA